MLLHPTSVTTLTEFTGVQEGDVQTNALDLRLGDVFAIGDQLFTIDNENKQHRSKTQMNTDDDGYYNLEPGHYEVVMENIITVGTNEAGFVITRSTLNRNGCFLTSGLYDTGYNGVMAGVLHVNCGPVRIKRGTRIGQYLNFDSESEGMYDGDYGVGKAHDQLYAGTDEAANED